MSVRTIRKPPALAGIMKAAGGLYARTALLQAREVMEATRAEHRSDITKALQQMTAWRDLSAASDADWMALREAAAEIIALCDPEAQDHLLRTARLLCEYVDRPDPRRRQRQAALVFIDALRVIDAPNANTATREVVMAELEALVQRQSLAVSSRNSRGG
jgi:hypothetical protein